MDTPALDQLAAEGMRFTNAYAASPVCTPTRAAMMTGQSPARLRITNHAPGNPVGFALTGTALHEAETIRHLPLAATTIAERLAAAGYATAHIGKWHLSHMSRKEQGVTEKELRPEKQGFDHNIGGDSGGERAIHDLWMAERYPDGALHSDSHISSGVGGNDSPRSDRAEKE